MSHHINRLNGERYPLVGGRGGKNKGRTRRWGRIPESAGEARTCPVLVMLLALSSPLFDFPF